MQVTSLRAQATEHRLIKEKLQAAVAAALSGDISADMHAMPQQSSDIGATNPLPDQAHQQQMHAAETGTVVDLQNAISSLKVSCH